jgi:protein subunit release factor A
MAADELYQKTGQVAALESDVKMLLLPKDEDDEKNDGEG